MKIRNKDDCPVDVIQGQMVERRPLPMGRQEFEEWSERILSGTLLPCEDKDSMKFALASMIMHLGPQESHKEDAYFIHSLRKVACNQVAHTIMAEIKDATERKLALEKLAKYEVTPIQPYDQLTTSQLKDMVKKYEESANKAASTNNQ